MKDRIVHVVGAIIERDGTVFAARRNPERSAGGLWEFPGGKIEAGETPEQALVRELQEELGVEVSVGELVDTSLSRVADLTIELACYRARLEGAAPTSSTDHDALTWVPIDELESLEWAPGDVPIIKRLPHLLAGASHTEEQRP